MPSRLLLLIALWAAGFAAAFGLAHYFQHDSAAPSMVWVPGGEFTMGTDGDLGWADEKPAHRVQVAGFWMDETDVTNARFRRFVQHPARPFERYPMVSGETPATGAFGYGNDFFAREFWRFVMVQERVAALAKTAIEYPPMQDPASFNLDAVKKQIDTVMRQQSGK